MASSNSAGAAAPPPAPFLTSGLESLLANEMADVDQGERIHHQWLKLQMADQARLMKDNQRILDTSLADDRALREQRHRFREGMMGRFGGAGVLQFPKDDTMGDIKIDSPTEIHHHYAASPSAPPQSPAAAAAPPPPAGLPGWAKAALVAGGLLVSGAGGAGLTAALTRGAAPPVNTTVEKTSGFGLELVAPPKEKNP